MAVNEGTRRIVGGVDTHKDLHVAAVVDEQDRVIKRDPSPPPVRAIARCSPGCAPSVTCNASV